MPTEIPKTHSLAITHSSISTRGFWLLSLSLLAGLSLIAWLLQRAVNQTVERQVEGNLSGVLESKVLALEAWLDSQQKIVEQSVSSEATCESLFRIINSQVDPTSVPVDNSRQTSELYLILSRTAKQLGASGYFVTERTGRLVASSIPELLGERLPPEYNPYFVRLMSKESVIVPPHQLCNSIGNGLGNESGSHGPADSAQLSIVSPIYREGEQPVGAVGFLIGAAGAFSELLNSGTSHLQLEIYAINARAQMVSEATSMETLRSVGLVPVGEEGPLNIVVRDPGMDLEHSQNFSFNPQACPMTLAASGVVSASETSDPSMHIQLLAYRNYRGIPVVGAWNWLPNYQIGVIAEMPHRTAFQTVHNVQLGLWGLMGLLTVSLGGTLLLARIAQAVVSRLGRAEKKLAKLGQYELFEKIGQGGMGEVYRARHALLRRETAVKICKIGSDSSSAQSRFQREVQAASQLNNPHTVRIFDYGQSEKGTFFYAMELLHGLNLSGLIHQFGTLTDGRTIYILRQICESLAEAHGLGLVHRDIKPSNVMIGRRGGIADFVKVLDFGLVRSFGANRTVSLTLDGCVAGTPHYMSPEASQRPQDVDPRSDLYSVGCLAFHLMCGQPPFKGNNPLEICLKQVQEQPIPIQDQSLSPICDQLSDIVMRCIAKSPSDRPQSALELMEELDQTIPVHPWNRAEAELWWRNNAEIAQKVMVAGPDTHATMNTKTPS